MADYESLQLYYYWKASSINGTYYTKVYYANSENGEYTEVGGGTGDGATTYVKREYTLPQAAQSETLYLKIVFNTSNAQSFIDEVDLSGIEASGVKMPTFDKVAGEVEVGTTVNITAETGCYISYTTDGTDPSSSETAVLTEGNTASVTINHTTTIRAIALDDDLNASNEVSATYTIVVDPPTFSKSGNVEAGTVVTITAGSGCTIAYTTDKSDPSTSETAVMTDGNTATVTITSSMTIKAIALDSYGNESEVAEAPYYVTVPVPTFSIEDGYKVVSGTEVTITAGSGCTIAYTTDGSNPSTSETAVMTDGNTAIITLNQTMTIKAIALDSYANESSVVSVSYKVRPADALFFETFDDVQGSGGRDGYFSGNIGSNDVTDELTEEDGWSFSNSCGAFECIKLGSSNNRFTATTRRIELNGDARLTFSAAGWGDTNSNTISVSAGENVTLSGDVNVTLANGLWNEYVVDITGATGSLTLTFTGKRGFLDDVLVTPVNSVTLADNGTQNATTISNNEGIANVKLDGRTLVKNGTWNTLCLPFRVDLTDENGVLYGATAKTLTGATMEGTHVSLTFGSNVEELEAGTPYIIKWESGSNIENPVFKYVAIDASEEAEARQTLSFADGHVKFIGYYDAFGITAADDNIYYMTTTSELKHTAKDRTLKACRAYFDFTASTQEALEFTMDFGEGTTVIQEAELNLDSGDGLWYTIDGRKLNSEPTVKGIYIYNGQKMIIK